MEENKNQQLAPLQMTKPVLQALAMKEITGLRYNEILQSASDLSFSKDNLASDYPALKELDRLLKLLDELRKRIQNPYYNVCTDTNAVFKELSKPLEEIRDKKKSELKNANEEAMIELRKAQQEQQRKENILLTLANFINNTTRSVSEATTDQQITAIQKLVGSEKSKKAFYAEYYNELVEKCSSLEQPIKDRKEFIQKQSKLQKELEAAVTSGDDVKATELKQQQEVLQTSTDESAILLQEVAFNTAASIQSVVPETIIETVKPKMKKWTWKVDDIVLLQKKMPHLVKLVPDEEAIDVLFKTKKAEGVLKDDEELKIFGLTIYQEKFY